MNGTNRRLIVNECQQCSPGQVDMVQHVNIVYLSCRVRGDDILHPVENGGIDGLWGRPDEGTDIHVH